MTYDLTRRRRRAVRPHPIFLAFVAAAVLSGYAAWRDDAVGSRSGDVAVFVLVVALWVVSLSLHEFAHAYAAYRAGDREAEALGYLTLNPFRYAHPVLSVLLPLFFIVQGGIGLPGGAVYLHRSAFRSRARQSLAAAAGPLVNVVVAAGTLALVHSAAASPGGDGGTWAAHTRFWAALAFFGFLQVTAAVLNLLPIPGLDGWAILEPYLDPATVRGANAIKPWGMLGVIVLLQINSLNQAFFRLVNALFDVSGVGHTLAALGHAFFQFWQRPPF